MSTHNIGFYEDLTNIIFELSSNIIKYSGQIDRSRVVESWFFSFFRGQLAILTMGESHTNAYGLT